MVSELNTDTATAYLYARGLVPPVSDLRIEELGWGISNVVLKAAWPRGCLVVKQSLPKLRVEADWQFDRSRVMVECACMRYLEQLLPAGSVPRVVFADAANFAFGMTCAPPGGTLWKQALLDGHVDPAAARHAGSLLARIHRESATDDAVQEQFADQTVLIQGRVDPYHRTAAEAHPGLEPAIDAEIERLLSTRRTLVLGDYSPKNIFVYPGHVLVLDFEVAHWGDPAFDVAFCLTHLVLKATAFRERARQYLMAARTFWNAYCAAGAPGVTQTESATVRELGCLLVARIDGKSKIEYITDERTKELVRGLARDLLASTEKRLGPVLDTIHSRLDAVTDLPPSACHD